MYTKVVNKILLIFSQLCGNPFCTVHIHVTHGRHPFDTGAGTMSWLCGHAFVMTNICPSVDFVLDIHKAGCKTILMNYPLTLPSPAGGGEGTPYLLFFIGYSVIGVWLFTLMISIKSFIIL